MNATSVARERPYVIYVNATAFKRASVLIVAPVRVLLASHVSILANDRKRGVGIILAAVDMIPSNADN